MGDRISVIYLTMITLKQAWVQSLERFLSERCHNLGYSTSDLKTVKEVHGSLQAGTKKLIFGPGTLARFCRHLQIGRFVRCILRDTLNVGLNATSLTGKEKSRGGMRNAVVVALSYVENQLGCAYRYDKYIDTIGGYVRK